MAKVKIPAWAATSPREVIGVDTTTGTPHICIATRDGESSSPKLASAGQFAGQGPKKARRFSPETLKYILDNEKQMRSFISAAERLAA